MYKYIRERMQGAAWRIGCIFGNKYNLNELAVNWKWAMPRLPDSGVTDLLSFLSLLLCLFLPPYFAAFVRSTCSFTFTRSHLHISRLHSLVLFSCCSRLPSVIRAAMSHGFAFGFSLQRSSLIFISFHVTLI